MEILIQSKYGNTEIWVSADNVKIEESISESEYALKEDGKKDFSRRLGEDITDSAMSTYTRLLEDIVYYRKKPFDASQLIRDLFNQLPKDAKGAVLKNITDDYDPDEE